MKHVYMVYGKPGCSFCTKALNLLKNKGYSYEYKELGRDYQFEQLVELNPHTKTFPQIFIGERLVGGYVDLEDEID